MMRRIWFRVVNTQVNVFFNRCRRHHGLVHADIVALHPLPDQGRKFSANIAHVHAEVLDLRVRLEVDLATALGVAQETAVVADRAVADID